MKSKSVRQQSLGDAPPPAFTRWTALQHPPVHDTIVSLTPE
ncbi:hypothetical protein [Methylibium sp.]|nr:hypothetical protein [Methylibium sp.]